MKKLLSVILCLILVLGCFPMTAMAYDTTIEGDGEGSIYLTTTVKEPESITVTPPTKTQYNVGGELDKTGMVVTVHYTDGSTADVTSAANLSGFDSSSKGEVTVLVSYTEAGITKTATFTVTIVEPVAMLYTISLSASPSEGGTVTGGGRYEENASVTLTATPAANYTFVRWTEDGTEVSTDASYTFTVTANRTLVAVFEEEEVIYTVTVEPGEGTGTAFTVQSTTILSLDDVAAGNYDETKGCFYRNDYGVINYRFPTECPFTAPGDKEFDCWEVNHNESFTMAAGSVLIIENYGNATITALWKEVQSSVTFSIPAEINVKYGDTQTAFDMQVKAASFIQGESELTIDLFNSSFTCWSHDGTIPFTVTTNADEASEIAGGGYGFTIYSNTELPYTCQGFINITGNDWAAAKPGSYTATLSVRVIFN